MSTRSSCDAVTSSPSFRPSSPPAPSSTPVTTTLRSIGCSSSSTWTRCAATSRSGVLEATSSSSASVSRPTTRCAASLRLGSRVRVATGQAAGRRRQSATSRQGRLRSSPGHRHTGRVTKRCGRKSSPTISGAIPPRSMFCTVTRRSRRTGSTRTGAAASPSAGRPAGRAVEKIIEKAREIVAHQLEVSRRGPRLRRTARSR